MLGTVRNIVAAAVGLAAVFPLVSATPLQSGMITTRDDSEGAVRSPAVHYNNTLALQRADPHIVKHTDGWYYFTATVPEYDKVILRRAETIQGLETAEEVAVFHRKESGQGSGQVWAPELHYIDGKWYIYVALGVEGEWLIRAYVLEGTGDNPLEATWEEKGIVETNWDEFSLDMHVFEANGIRYASWAQFDPTWGDTNTGLFLAPLTNPWTLQLPAVAITYPDLDWERIGHNVNEGAYVIKRDGKIYLTYSASATDHNYCLGLLTANEDADLMDPSVWTKSPEPVFVSSAETSQWGPGHNSFTVSEDGLSDVMVYHARQYKEIDGDPLNDPNRHTRVQKLYWRADGTPDFGIPVPDGATPVRLRLAVENDLLYVRNEGVGSPIVVSDENNKPPLAETQFRIVKPGLGGEGTVSLESTNLPGRYLRRSEGTVVLAEESESDDFKTNASFIQEEGLSDTDGFSFAVPETEQYMRADDQGNVIVGPVAEGEANRATFITE